MLEIKGLKKSFDEKIIFSDFSFKFEEKGIYAIIGRSGVGKTTLLRIISGLDIKFDGEVMGAGKENISYVFQEHRLFPNLSALQNALVPIKNPTADQINKAKFLFNYLDFTEDEMDLIPAELSGGMKQRVSLIRALMKECPILLLDEPTKELNAELVDKVYKLMKDESEKRLVIYVTHNEIGDDDVKIINLDDHYG